MKWQILLVQKVAEKWHSATFLLPFSLVVFFKKMQFYIEEYQTFLYTRN